MQQQWLDGDRGLFTAHNDGSMSLGISLDRSRCVSVTYNQFDALPGDISPETRVTVESRDPDISLMVHKIIGRDTFFQGVEFAMTLIIILELLADHEIEDLADDFVRGELFPDSHVAKTQIAAAHTALMTARAVHAARRAG